MSGCQNYTAFMTAERNGLRVAIAENRCLLSQRVGTEVGENTAKQDFVDHLLNTFAQQFRRNYCKSCPSGRQCLARYCDERPVIR